MLSGHVDHRCLLMQRTLLPFHSCLSTIAVVSHVGSSPTNYAPWHRKTQACCSSEVQRIEVHTRVVSYALYVLAGLNVFAAISRVAMIGMPRKPVARSDAIASVVFCAAVATILVIAAIRLG